MNRVSKPAWLKSPYPAAGPHLAAVASVIRRHGLHTVCSEAGCPNKNECWGQLGIATFLIMGGACTRDCRFCKVGHGRPAALDPAEPERVAAAAAELGLRYCVITSVTRDDLADGGAAHFHATVRAVRGRNPECKVEVLTPDFWGREESVATVLDAGPHVFGHNLETVRRLTPLLRSGADYDRSRRVLRSAARHAPATRVKSALLLGLGETAAEITGSLEDLRQAGVSIVHLGQYLQPSARQEPVRKYYPPEEFAQWGERARALGFSAVQSGPLVRSSYHAHQALEPGYY